jgi:hypothetical protein
MLGARFGLHQRLCGQPVVCRGTAADAATAPLVPQMTQVLDGDERQATAALARLRWRVR